MFFFRLVLLNVAPAASLSPSSCLAMMELPMDGQTHLLEEGNNNTAQGKWAYE